MEEESSVSHADKSNIDTRTELDLEYHRNNSNFEPKISAESSEEYLKQKTSNADEDYTQSY